MRHGDTGDFYRIDGMIAFQARRADELDRYYAGDRRAEAPAVGIKMDFRTGPSLATAWGINPRAPFAGK